MARRNGNAKPPGGKYKTAKTKAVKITDQRTGETVATIRWGPCGVVHIEHERYLKPKVVVDSPTKFA